VSSAGVYRIVVTSAARRAINHLEVSIKTRILARIDTLASNPRPPGAIKLEGQQSYRVRVGDYRIVYMVEDEIVTVTIIRVGHRREVYR
jgi:mRNA interferase RelE/StbE